MARANPHVQGGFSHVLAKDFEELFFDGFARPALEYPKFMTAGTWGEYSIKKGNLATLGAHLPKDEAGAIAYDGFEQGDEKEVTFTSLALAFEVSRELYDDDRTGKFRNVSVELGKSAAYTKELYAFALLNEAFSSTDYLGLDGLVLCSASHQSIDDAQTWSNTSTDSLTATTLEAGLLTFGDLENERGLPIPGAFKPSILVTGTALSLDVDRYLGSEKRPGTADNDKNVLRNYGLTHQIVHYLSSSTAWFLMAPNNDLQLIMRKDAQFEAGDDFNTKNARYSSVMRLAPAFWEWRGVYGSTGA